MQSFDQKYEEWLQMNIKQETNQRRRGLLENGRRANGLSGPYSAKIRPFEFLTNPSAVIHLKSVEISPILVQ
ncbi:hypothetical protein HZF08_19020 [Paenibacillus sp. CGMCC 1.16610]|uniref:Uncharacterized protein n=1 Tax=Paenibacillus anseongense TaxID=2682845 RepID=A0ABW9U638_9BACL|nr:hypothetical protein [Paenibacillus sp. CGMCC 1.16610]MBA2940392.1 hypothetical protein [Paenibacillus sp. CGMCC 1.16610]MVQ35569.1 hypothetical protein [Paenibacillus anseongense]